MVLVLVTVCVMKIAGFGCHCRCWLSLSVVDLLQAVAKFSRLQHLEMSYSSTPGTIADVANITKQLPQLQQLHLRGVGLHGPFSCELVESSMSVAGSPRHQLHACLADITCQLLFRSFTA